jgi:hypothetical protein
MARHQSTARPRNVEPAKHELPRVSMRSLKKSSIALCDCHDGENGDENMRGRVKECEGGLCGWRNHRLIVHFKSISHVKS